MKGSISRRCMAAIISAVMLMSTGAMAFPMGVYADTYYLENGSITVTANDEGQFVTQASNDEVQNKSDNNPVIRTDDPSVDRDTLADDGSTTNTITINAEAGQTANVTFKDVNIDKSEHYGPAVDITGAGDVIIELDGNNIAKSGERGAGIQKEENTGNLTIADSNATAGILTANGGQLAAAIGGGNAKAGTDITITGGTIYATGGGLAAAIGGGWYGDGTNITITGGTVNARSGSVAAAIGGGSNGNGINITISGGTVTAIGDGSGIGSGNGTDNSTAAGIKISGGTVTAIGGETYPGIGGGECTDAVIISGPAIVNASGGAENDYQGHGAAIGTRGSNHSENGTEKLDSTGLYNTGRINIYPAGTTIDQMSTVQPVATYIGTIEDPNPVIPPNPSGQNGTVIKNTNDNTNSESNNSITNDTTPVDEAHAFVAETDAKLEGYINNILALIAAGKIEEANALIANGILIDTGRWHTFNKDTCALLEKASQLGIKVTLHYEYDHTKYSTTIPAKTTINPVSLCDVKGFVGFMNFYKYYGGFVRK